MQNGLKRLFKNIFLGVDYDEDEEILEEYSVVNETEPVVKESHLKEVTSLEAFRDRRNDGEKSKILNFRSGHQIQVMITNPKEITDATVICDYLHEGSACVVNLDGVERPHAQRIADFLGGAVYAFNGEMQRISTTIFIIAPSNVHINGEMEEELKSGGFLFPRMASSMR